MPQDADTRTHESVHTEANFTWQEIHAQPQLWPLTIDSALELSERLELGKQLSGSRVALTGAGTSAYAAEAIAAAWPGAIAISSTDLLVDAPRLLEKIDVLISIARSGNSPESAPVVKLARDLRPDLFQLAIVCNAKGALAGSEVDHVLALDPRTDDKSLVMTSSFSNLVIAGLTLARPQEMRKYGNAFSQRAASVLSEIEQASRLAASHVVDRIVVLASSPLEGWRQESSLKLLEMNAGRYPVLAESYLGLRHGPMVFAKPDTLVLCLLSNDLLRRAYELDLLRELRSKQIGYLVGIGAEGEDSSLFDLVLPSVASGVEDYLRTPFEIPAAQLLGYHSSVLSGLNPDNPSPDGVINRVVQGVTIHAAAPRDSATSHR